MASSSVSQDDIDTDFEKNSRRSRIRTARARQINPVSSTCRMEPPDPSGIVCSSIASSDVASASSSALACGGAPSSISMLSNGGNDDDFGGNNLEESKEFDHETSPKPLIRTVKENAAKRPNKMHHMNKGKQQRERRKLREKRRSTGVVHLASTESTGGSTTGDDEESSGDETKRNTQHNESAVMDMPTPHQQQQSLTSSAMRRNVSDLEADDENDTHDSLNHSSSSVGGTGPFSSTLPCETATTLSTASTPVMRPCTPVCSDEADVERVVEENKRLLSMMDEKDRKINHLETKIQQLMKDTLTISEEQSRLQRENKTLLRALSNLTMKEKGTNK